MPKVVGIDPVTGAPIMEEVGSSFEVSLPSTPSTGSIAPKLPSDAIPKPVTEAKPLVGIDNSIEEARRFNEKLNAPTPVPVTRGQAEVEQEQKVNKDVELKSILKRYGMDSQQQDKAFAEIKSLFG